MPLYGRFTRYGHFRYSAQPSKPEKIYNALVASMGDQFSLEEGSKEEAELYANAMLLARASNARERCANEMDPNLTRDMLPVHEHVYGLVPGLRDTIQDRQQALAAKRLARVGGSFTAISNALAALLGSDFIAFRVTPTSEALVSPSDPGAGPGIWARTALAPKTIRLESSVAVLGTPWTVNYSPLDRAGMVTIEQNDVLVVSANNIGIAEVVTVVAATSSTLTAVFTKSHDPGDVATTGYFPYWLSTKLHHLVVVTPACAADPNKRRLINQRMNEVVRGTATWDIAPSSDGVHTDRFTLDSATLGLPGYAINAAVTF